MVTVQASSCLPQVVRLKKIEELSQDLRGMMKTLSLKEADAVNNVFESSSVNVKDEKMAPWD